MLFLLTQPSKARLLKVISLSLLLLVLLSLLIQLLLIISQLLVLIIVYNHCVKE